MSSILKLNKTRNRNAYLKLDQSTSAGMVGILESQFFSSAAWIIFQPASKNNCECGKHVHSLKSMDRLFY